MTDTQSDGRVISKDLAARVKAELGGMRAEYVHDRVSRTLAHREGNMTREQVDQLEADSYLRWNELHPGLFELWFDTLGPRA